MYKSLPGRSKGQFDRAAADAAATLGAATVVLVASKGAISFVQDWGSVYWWLDYRDGMVRRGLVGQLFQALAGRLDKAHLYPPVMTLQVLLIAVLAVAMLVPFSLTLGRLRPGKRLGFIALCTGLFVSQLWPTLTFNVGYLDPLLLVLALGAAIALRREWRLAAAALMALGPVIHEYFLFLVPFVLASRLDRGELRIIGFQDPENPRPRRLLNDGVLAAIAAASALAVVFTAHRQAAAAQFARMPLDPALKITILDSTMTQSPSAAMARMLGYFLTEPGYALFNALFFMAPALLACVGLLFWRAPRRNLAMVLQCAAALFPVAALLVAWDLSRLLVMTTFTAGMMFLMAAERRTRLAADDAPGDARPARWFPVRALLIVPIGAAVIAYAAYPFTYTYFRGRPFFQYFPPADRRRFMARSHAAFLAESIWGHREGPFADADVACQLWPRAAPGQPCTRMLASGMTVYGPYLALPLGLYRATFLVSAPSDCKNPVTLDVVDFGVTDTPLAQSQIVTGGDQSLSLTFRVADETARRGDFEFRTRQLSGPACVTLNQLHIARLTP